MEQSFQGHVVHRPRQHPAEKPHDVVKTIDEHDLLLVIVLVVVVAVVAGDDPR
jgi:hypothetical protein